MTSPEHDQLDASGGDAGATRARGLAAAALGVLAVLLLAAVIGVGVATARSWDAASSADAAARTVPATGAPATAADPYRLAAGICTASQADMERWVTAAQASYPDAEGFADFLGHEAAVIGRDCPQARATYDAATWAAADVRLGPTN